MHWMSRHRRLVIAAICLASTLLVLLGRVFPDVPFLFAPWLAEERFQDLLRRQGRVTPERADFVFLGIDQQSLQLDVLAPEEIEAERGLQLMTERPFPWSRELWALLLDKLFAAGARLVVFDMIFNPPNEGDPAFAAALERYRDKVVIGANFDIARENQLVVPNATLIPPPQARDDRVGFVNFWPDGLDGRVRAMQLAITDRQLAGQAPYPGAEVFISLDARALAKMGIRWPSIDTTPTPFRFGPAYAYAPENLYEVFLPATWQANFRSGEFFKDKVVLIGASAQVMHDVVDTPISPATPGPALHLHAMAAAAAGEFLTYTPLALRLVLVSAAGAVAWLLVALIRRPLFSLFALLGAAIAYLIAARLLYDTHGFLLFTVPVLSVLLLSGLLSMGFEYALERMEKLRTRRTLERYVSKNLVREILDNPGGYYNSLRGTRKPATILFSDIVGFTAMTETADPAEIVTQLNEYLTRMVSVVFENGGTLDKFIGDAVMAVWGNVRSAGVAADAHAAARSALAMKRELKDLNARWRAHGRTELGIGIGINQGDVLIGNIGSYGEHERLDPTVIGDAVNLAARLEGLTRTYGVEILVGPTASELIRDGFHLRSVARVQVKGRREPVEIFTVLGERTEPLDPEFLQWLATYEEGVAQYRAREFTKAKTHFARFLEFYPDDSLAKIYLERSVEFEREPPDETWDAAEVFTKK